MARVVTLFFSWQSDRAEMRALIRDALRRASDKLSKEDVHLVIDEATRDLPGSPDIGTSIKKKIRAADMFLADLTIVGRAAGKAVPNANVVYELGFADAAFAEDANPNGSTILVVNTAHGKPERLPFDLRQRRATTFSLEGAGHRNAARDTLSGHLIEAIRSWARHHPVGPPAPLPDLWEEKRVRTAQHNALLSPPDGPWCLLLAQATTPPHELRETVLSAAIEGALRGFRWPPTVVQTSATGGERVVRFGTDRVYAGVNRSAAWDAWSDGLFFAFDMLEQGAKDEVLLESIIDHVARGLSFLSRYYAALKIAEVSLAIGWHHCSGRALLAQDWELDQRLRSKALAPVARDGKHIFGRQQRVLAADLASVGTLRALVDGFLVRFDGFEMNERWNSKIAGALARFASA